MRLEKSLSSLDIDELIIGVNEANQFPQDIKEFYCQGCQTDIIMFHDVGTDTRKITLDSSIQSDINSLEMYSQTDKPFLKTKGVQTTDSKISTYIQTNKPKLRNTVVQTLNRLSNKSTQTVVKTQYLNISTQTNHIMNSKETINQKPKDAIVNQDIEYNNRHYDDDRSESPPLSPDKVAAGPSRFSLPFVSLITPLAVRLSSIGTE